MDEPIEGRVEGVLMHYRRSGGQCNKCKGKGWIENKPQRPMLGPLSVECPRCLGGRKHTVDKESM